MSAITIDRNALKFIITIAFFPGIKAEDYTWTYIRYKSMNVKETLSVNFNSKMSFMLSIEINFEYIFRYLLAARVILKVMLMYIHHFPKELLNLV